MIHTFDIWILLVALLSNCVAAQVAFAFVSRIYLSQLTLKRQLTTLFSLAIGTALIANHFILSFALRQYSGTIYSYPYLLAAWLLACAIGYLMLSISTKRTLDLVPFIRRSLAICLVSLVTYYCCLVSNHTTAEIRFDSFALIAVFLFSSVLIATSNLLFFWIKNYNGKHPLIIKQFTAMIIACMVIAVHVAFSYGISAAYEISDNTFAIESKLMGTIIALAFVSVFLLLFIFTLVLDKHGEKYLKFSFLNTTNNSESEAKYQTDSLTNLGNRRAFEQHLANAAKRSMRTEQTFAVAYIDLDYFKPINDLYGHHVGDAVLTTVAGRLSTAVRGCDFVARIGGDEFVIIFEQVTSGEDITQIADRIVKSIKEPMSVKSYKIDTSCSMGIAIYAKDGDLKKLTVQADAAMYRAKEEGKNQFKFYDNQVALASNRMMILQRELRMAIDEGQFSLVYLPKMDCRTMSSVGVEALIRWNHPSKGLILPDTFIPAAERFGFINEIGNWVIEESCRMIAHAKQSGQQLNVSINLSSHQFHNQNLVKNVVRSIRHYGLDPSNLTFEIKEALAINNQGQFKYLLERFQEAGIRVLLDDFGLQPISLTYLLDLNIDEIKIHRFFISVIHLEKSARALVDAVIKLAHALNLKVVAEGVENAEQRDVLVDLGCDYMQGHLFSKPVAETELLSIYNDLEGQQLQIDFDDIAQYSSAIH
jgi:diguanylate cyclase